MKNTYYYAELNENGICKAIIESGLHPNEVANIFIPIPLFNDDYLGKKYDNGEWLEVEQSNPVQQETQLDRIEKSVNMLVNDVSVTDVLLGVE